MSSISRSRAATHVADADADADADQGPTNDVTVVSPRRWRTPGPRR
jgi:hypothetical protein